MATNQPSASTSGTAGPTQEYTVRTSRDSRRKCSILKFNPSNKVDFTKCGAAKIERENNLKEYKLSNDIDQMPKFGAGSQFGKEAKDEARRRKYGIMLKRYNPEDQPWIIKFGSGKQTRTFKGTKEGGISDHSSYYIFTQSGDGAFEAMPVDEWHSFNPVIKYKYLNSEEAEEEFERRDKTMNLFTIMVKKRLKNDDLDNTDADEVEKKLKTSAKKKGKDFLLTEMDEWADISSGEEEEEDDDDEGKEEKKKKKAKDSDDDEDDPTKAKKKKAQPKNKPQSSRRRANSDDEALEDSDDLDEGQEVDYMTDTDSEDEDMYADTEKMKTEKYQEKGVEDEDGLRKVINSDEEGEEQEEEKKEEESEETKDKPKKEDKETKKQETKPAKEDSDSESSDSSGSDSDPEKETSTFASALFMQKSSKSGGGDKKGSDKNAPKNGSASSGSSAANSRSTTPTVPGDAEKKGKKRKPDGRDSPLAKKAKSETDSQSSTPIPPASEGVSDEAVRRYLMRKPMTISELLQKFKKAGLSKDQLTTTIVQILKRLNPEKKKIHDKLYLSLRKPE